MFWEYSLREVVDLIESHNRKLTAKTKEKYYHNYTLAQMISNNVARLLSSDVESLTVYDYAPELFKKEKEELDELKKQRDLELHKERMRLFAERFNVRRRDNYEQ